ncbi:hypothetical protein RJ639_038560 [Escallonia herrerae]|uniref:Uncharacterized protein n=1 Tax=Escallonia herrerae TaxID=1293975 RepID=A0AA89B5R4_9ASTE|nr:hypothetical protein RJ639_038560 [Escallonia herrerae]
MRMLRDNSRGYKVRPEQIPVPVLLRGPSPSPHRPRARARPGLVADAVERVDHGLASSVIMSPTSTTKYSSGRPAVRSRKARTSSRKSSEGCDGSGRKSLGCQQRSTGLRSGRTDLVAHGSRDLKTSAFSGGIEWVTWWRSGGGAAATVEGGGGRRRRRWDGMRVGGVARREKSEDCMAFGQYPLLVP